MWVFNWWINISTPFVLGLISSEKNSDHCGINTKQKSPGYSHDGKYISIKFSEFTYRKISQNRYKLAIAPWHFIRLKITLRSLNASSNTKQLWHVTILHIPRLSKSLFVHILLMCNATSTLSQYITLEVDAEFLSGLLSAFALQLIKARFHSWISVHKIVRFPSLISR